MGTSLSGLTPATTFDGLLKVGDNDPLTADLKAISTGDGTDTILQLSNTALQVNGQATIVGLTTSAGDSAILAQNSDAYTLLQVRNDGTTAMNNGSYVFSAPQFICKQQSVIYQSLAVGQTASPTSRLQVKGSGADNTTTSLLVQNSAGDNIIKANDDGKVAIGAYNSDTYLNYLLDLKAPLNTNGETLLRLQSNATLTPHWVGIGFTTSTNGNAVQAEIRGYRDAAGRSIAFHFGSNESMRVWEDGDVGIGETTPTARLHIKGSGNDDTTNALLVQNSAGTNLLKVDDGGFGFYVNDDEDGKLRFYSSGNTGTIFGARNLRITSGGGNAINIAGTGSNGVIIGTTDSTLAANTALVVRGQGATSATTALLVQNNAGAELFKVTDDGGLTATLGNTTLRSLAIDRAITNGASSLYANKGSLVVGLTFPRFNQVNETYNTLHDIGNYTSSSGTGTYATLGIENTINQTGTASGITRGVYVNPTLTSAVDYRSIETTGGQVILKSSGNDATTTALLVQNSDGDDIIKVRDNGYAEFPSALWYTYSTSGISYIRKQGASPLALYIDGSNFLELSTSGVGIGQSNAAAKLHIKGSGNDATTTALLVQNSDGTDMLKVTDDARTIFYGLIVGSLNIGNNTPIEINGTTALIGSSLTNEIKLGTGFPYQRVIVDNSQLIVKGRGNDNTTTALLVENSTGADLFKVDDAGGAIVSGRLDAAYFVAGSSVYAGSYATVKATKIVAAATGAGINIQTSTTNVAPDASAVLQADSTTQGFLPPRMTEGERNAIAAPVAVGLIVYQTDGAEGVYVNTSTGWKQMQLIG